MKRIFSPIFYILPLLISMQINAQEVIYPLNVNQAQIDKKKDRSHSQIRSSFVDTVSLPFEDDFSRPGMEPFDGFWLGNSGVYINSNFTHRPVTIGIATFDGLNEFGIPYQPFSSQDSVADILTSKPINLVVQPNDTTVWLSFFYEASSVGDPPEAGDSLVLQFKDTGNVWSNVWAADAGIIAGFQRVNIRIIDLKYLFNGFQFRFFNIATVNGNRDHWNLDYVKLDDRRIQLNGDMEDFCLLKPLKSLLAEFTSMPYAHYKVLGTPPPVGTLVDSLRDTVHVLDYGPTTLFPHFDIFEPGSSTPAHQISLIEGGTPNTDSAYASPLNYAFPALSSDSADFLVKSYLNEAATTQNKFNDTSYYTQKFHNYYSYDDGSAEVAYGLTGNVDVSMAYMFNVKVADTLRGVQIYFNPTGVNVTNKLFQLTVWTDINLSTNQSIELYRLINQKPDTFAGINGFKTFYFDTTLIVGPGNIWVGIIQNEPQTLYGVGLDRNTDSRNKFYYHLDGIWSQSSIKGSWLIRPFFGKKISLVSVDENALRIASFSIIPNPASKNIHFDFENISGKKYHYQIYDCLGNKIKEESLSSSKEVDISDLAKGIYIVRLLSSGERNGLVQKLIVQ